MVPAYHPGMVYTPDDISQIPDNHPGFIPASDDERERLTILLHKQIRADLADIRYGATEKTIREIERRYRRI